MSEGYQNTDPGKSQQPKNQLEPEERTVTVRAFPRRIRMSGKPFEEKAVPSFSEEDSFFPKSDSAQLNSEDSFSLSHGLRLLREIKFRLKRFPHAPLGLETFAKALEGINICAYLETQKIRNLDQFLVSFYRVIRNQNRFYKTYGFRVRGISFQDEVSLFHRGLLAIQVPEYLVQTAQFPIECLKILDACEFDRRHHFDNLQFSRFQKPSGAIEYDIFNCPTHQLAVLEKGWGKGFVLVLSRKLTDSVRYFQFRQKRSGTSVFQKDLGSPERINQKLLQKIGGILVHLLVRARVASRDPESRYYLEEYQCARKTISQKLLDQIENQIRDQLIFTLGKNHQRVLSPEEQLREEIILLSEQPQYWNFPGVGHFVMGHS